MNNNNVLSICNGDGDAARRREILNLFLEDNPAFEVCLRNLKDRDFPDSDRIALKAYDDEPLAARIERYCLNLQSVLFTLSVFPEVKIPDVVLDGFFDITGELVYALHHLADDIGKGVGDDVGGFACDYMGDHSGEGVPRLRCAPSGLRENAVDAVLAGREKVSALTLLGMLRGGSL